MYLRIDAGNFASQDIHVRILAFGAAFLFAVHAQLTVTLLGANAAAFHGLTAGRVRQLPRDLDMQFQESLQCHVGRKGLHALQIRRIFGSINAHNTSACTSMPLINGPESMHRASNAAN